LGIDLGTTFTAAAVARDGRVEVVGLGNHAAAIPSAVLLRDDGEMLVGDAAMRRGQQEPARLAREFKRRLGDAAPIILGNTPYSSERLMAAVIRYVVDAVTERQGEPPDRVAIAHPANWGPYKRELLQQAAQLAGLDDVRYVTEPEAAAVHFAAGERVDEGGVVAVYDLGGGTFDAAVLRRTATGFVTLGEPQGIERLGGIDFDESVMSHVRATLGDALTGLDQNDPAVRAAMVRLREECVAAKEALSEDSEAVIPVMAPGLQTQVRLTRPEFETMIRPVLRETVETLNRALRSAGVTAAELSAVVLAGGSSRIPLVAEMVSASLGRAVAVDAHPKHTVALGAAMLAADVQPTPAAVAPAPAAVAPPVIAADVQPTPAPPSPPAPSQPAARATPPAPASAPPPKKRRGALIAIAAVVIAAAAAGAFFLLGGGDGDDTGASPGSTDGATEGTDAPSNPVVNTGDGSGETTTPSVNCAAPSGLCVTIDSFQRDGDQFVVEYSTLNYEPDIDGQFHVHFFFDTTPITEAGNPGHGDWVVYDLDENGEKVYRFPTSDVPPNATTLCAAVAAHNHSLDSLESSCAPIPQ
jgi:actin-like ATPase involved in cell morphogenesis